MHHWHAVPVFAGCEWWKPAHLIGLINRIRWLKPFRCENELVVTCAREAISTIIYPRTTYGDSAKKRWLFYSKRVLFTKCWFCYGTNNVGIMSYAMTFGGDYGYKDSAESMILSASDTLSAHWQCSGGSTGVAVCRRRGGDVAPTVAVFFF